MNRARLLCRMDRVMMETFSRQTVTRLQAHTLFRLALPPFQSFLQHNVAKEVEKDRRVITRAADLVLSGGQPEPSHVEALLQEARQVDQDFLRRVAVFPIDIQIQYQDIEHYRQQRIELMLNTSYRLLAHWRDGRSFRITLQQLYSQAQCQELIHDMLRLYAMETHMLSRSIRIPHLLGLARDKLIRTIIDAMEHEATALANSATQFIFTNPD